jgi:uncharacterized membrane protein
MNAPRSIDEYLKQLRAALAGEDAALIQDALYDAEEYLRAEVAAHPGKSEPDVLELIASTYGAPDEVAAAYRDTEAKVKEALKTPTPAAVRKDTALARFFGVYLDPRAYTSLFYMLLSLATGILYFTIVVTGLSLSAGFAVLIIGIPFFLAFIGITRVISLGEGRLLEAVSGERMPRRPLHPGPTAGWWARITEMLKDARTWTTLAYLVLMLPLGIVYFTLAITGLAIALAFVLAPLDLVTRHFGLSYIHWGSGPWLAGSGSLIGALILCALGVLMLTLVLHVVRVVVRGHSRLAKSLLVEPGAAATTG